ncbi:hypothetical protein EXN66_Car015131 [Channa argus]|uniref:C2H2-type domain-containing protein n=1 Tax=Channa argus TaxID=215402 RepID=A0A6G1QAK0_CHAAH|nr:hypothetical protein EXN66_Car015131 [Channa argus]
MGFAVQCTAECSKLYVRESKQALHESMAQHRRSNTTGPEPAVYLQLKDERISFKDREDKWYKRLCESIKFTRRIFLPKEEEKASDIICLLFFHAGSCGELFLRLKKLLGEGEMFPTKRKHIK